MSSAVYVDNYGGEYVPTDFNDQDVYIKKRNEILTNVFDDFDDEITFCARIKHPKVSCKHLKGVEVGRLTEGTLIVWDSYLYDYSKPEVHQLSLELAEDYPHIAVKADRAIGYWDVGDGSFTFENAFTDFRDFLKSLSMYLVGKDVA